LAIGASNSRLQVKKSLLRSFSSEKRPLSFPRIAPAPNAVHMLDLTPYLWDYVALLGRSPASDAA
jgi:hypothetical protein